MYADIKREKEMENEFSKAFPLSFAMKGGEGPHSYAQNSAIQAFHFNTIYHSSYFKFVNTHTYIYRGMAKNF